MMKDFSKFAVAVAVTSFAFSGLCQAQAQENKLTSPYGVDAVKATLRAAEGGKIADRYGFPKEVPEAYVDDHVIAVNSVIMKGKAKTAIERLSRDKPLEIIDGTFSTRDLEKGLEKIREIWKETTRKDCPLTIKDFTCPNQEAVASSVVACRFPKAWDKAQAKFKGKSIEDGVSFGASISETKGKTTFSVKLSDHTVMYGSEKYDSLEDIEEQLQSGEEGNIIVPKLSLKSENDYSKSYPEFFSGDRLAFSEGRACSLYSFREVVEFSLDENGVSGISVTIATAGVKGIFFKPEPEKEVYVDEPFKLFIVTELKDGSKAVLFDIEVNKI